MSRKTSYSVLLAIVLVYSICCLPIVKASGATLHRDVLLVTNSTQNLEDPAANNTAQYDYTTDNAELQQVDNTINPVSGGLRGILYDSGDACGNNGQPGVIPPSLQSQRIALISSSVSCSIYDQLLYVQNQKAIGAIIYKFANDSVNSLSSNNEAQINIPAFIISYNAGQDLLNVLNEFNKNETVSSPAGYEVIRVTMVPAQNGFGSAWQIAILVVGCLLAVSFLISVGIHFRLYKLRRQERTEIVAQQAINSSSKLDVYTLSESIVKKFPTTVYHKNSDVRVSIFGSVGRRESRGSDSQRDSTRSITFDPKKLGEKSMTEEDFKSETCAICLEEFEEGETLRQLPKCSHLFHTECIDRWLTTKSSQCPLCKRDCTPGEVMKKRQKAEQLQSRLSNLYSISNSNFSYHEFDNEAYDNQRNSTFGRILGWFGHGDSSDSRDVHTRPQGNDPIQSLSPVAVRPVNVNRVV